MCDFIEKCVRPNGGCSVLDMSEYEEPPCFADQKHLTGNLDPVAESPACNALLGTKHQGCRISAPGILGRIRDGWKMDDGMRYATGEMLKHLEETAKRFYAGDVKAIDEFLQLYCLDETRP